jgi:hypothetical protein
MNKVKFQEAEDKADTYTTQGDITITPIFFENRPAQMVNYAFGGFVY